MWLTRKITPKTFSSSFLLDSQATNLSNKSNYIMNYATFQKYEFPSSPQNIASTTPRKRRLTAQWLTVDGKLICNWITAEK